MTITPEYRRKFFFGLQLIGAAFCLFEGSFVMIRNMSSIAETEDYKALYVTIGLIIVGFKNLFRMKGKKYIPAWAFGAAITGFCALSFVLTGTEAQVAHIPGIVQAQKIEIDTPEKVPQFIKDAYSDLRAAQKALSDLQTKQGGYIGYGAVTALDDSISKATETLSKMQIAETDARTRWYATLEAIDSVNTKQQTTALEIFGRVWTFLAVFDAQHITAFVFWIFVIAFVEWIDFYSFGPTAAPAIISESVKRGKYGPRTPISELITKWVSSNWVNGSTLISQKSFYEFWKHRDGFPASAYAKIKNAALDVGIIGAQDEIRTTDQAEATRILIDRLG